jgi:hypothetical protein
LKKPLQAACAAVATMTTAIFTSASETLPQSNRMDAFRSYAATPHTPGDYEYLLLYRWENFWQVFSQKKLGVFSNPLNGGGVG